MQPRPWRYVDSKIAKRATELGILLPFDRYRCRLVIYHKSFVRLISKDAHFSDAMRISCLFRQDSVLCKRLCTLAFMVASKITSSARASTERLCDSSITYPFICSCSSSESVLH
jgi:hypothetical protein